MLQVVYRQITSSFHFFSHFFLATHLKKNFQGEAAMSNQIQHIKYVFWKTFTSFPSFKLCQQIVRMKHYTLSRQEFENSEQFFGNTYEVFEIQSIVFSLKNWFLKYVDCTIARAYVCLAQSTHARRARVSFFLNRRCSSL